MSTMAKSIPGSSVAPGMSATFEVVTPEWARSLLANRPRNRVIVKESVEAFVRDMHQGRWMTTHQGLALDSEGLLMDGQHRLSAIVKSNKSQVLLVVRGVSRLAMSGIDVGRKRDAADILGLILDNESVTRNLVATIRHFGAEQSILAPRRATTMEIMDVLLAYSSSIYFASMMKNATAPVRAAVVSAHAYGVDGQTLTRFITVLANGIVAEPYEEIIIRLRDFIVNPKIPKVGSEATHEMYRKTERAIEAFVHHETLQSLSGRKYEIFPLELDHATYPQNQEDFATPSS